MLLKEQTDLAKGTGGSATIEIETVSKSSHTLASHPLMREMSDNVRRVLEKTKGLHRVLRYIGRSENPDIKKILEEISDLENAHLLLSYLPLLEQIYRFGDL